MVKGGGWMGGRVMGGESNGPGQLKHPETQIFHTTSARDCQGRPSTYLNVVTVWFSYTVVSYRFKSCLGGVVCASSI